MDKNGCGGEHPQRYRADYRDDVLGYRRTFSSSKARELPKLR